VCWCFSQLDCCKTNQQVSLKLVIMTGPTSRKNPLTFGGDSVPDTDQFCLNAEQILNVLVASFCLLLFTF